MGPIPLHPKSFDLVYLSKRLSTQSPPIFTENDLNDTTFAAAHACTEAGPESVESFGSRLAAALRSSCILVHI